MKERKYKEDYGFRSYIDSRGKEKREAVYQGDYFAYEGGAPVRKKALVESLVFFAICLILYFVYMKLNTPSSSCMYVLPISACALIVLVYWAMGLFSMWRAPEKMTRLQKENGVGRVLRSSVGCGVLLAMASLGDILFMLLTLKERYTEEILGFAFLACAAMAAMGCFLRVRETYNKIRTIAASKGGEDK
ncbi:MAG: hypothetical protein J6K72_02485 [Clostridia bacterium]|nr:hypothetical protein [Clostridia bacterium]